MPFLKSTVLSLIKEEPNIASPHHLFSVCPVCFAEFEIDDRLECVFVDPAKLRLPVNGTVCPVCRLVEDDQVGRCVHCGIRMTTIPQ
jgi:hypothetical protein